MLYVWLVGDTRRRLVISFSFEQDYLSVSYRLVERNVFLIITLMAGQQCFSCNQGTFPFCVDKVRINSTNKVSKQTNTHVIQIHTTYQTITSTVHKVSLWLLLFLSSTDWLNLGLLEQTREYRPPMASYGCSCWYLTPSSFHNNISCAYTNDVRYTFLPAGYSYTKKAELSFAILSKTLANRSTK